MNMIDGILEFIRSWVYPLPEETSRKRRAPVGSPEFSPKYRKVLSPMSQNTPENTFNQRSGMRISPNNSTIILDDEQNQSKFIDIKPRNRLNDSYRKSSPQFRDNDLSFNKITKSTLEKKREAEKMNFAYITNFTKTREPITTRINGNHQKISPIHPHNDSGKIPKIKQQLFTSPSLDFSIRLDDKRKYKELLNVTALASSLNNSPTNSYNLLTQRNRRIVPLKSPKRSIKPVEFIDLTEHETTTIPNKLNTKDTLMKVLNNFENNENEPDIIEDDDSDSDSDVEILPEPPSPKPDIRVEPINSFKTVAIDTSKTAHKQWLDFYSDEYDRSIEDKSKVIQMYTDNASQLSQINHDLLVKKLTKKINDSLTIKTTILPVIEIEEEQELPELTDNQIKEIKKALSPRDPHYTLITKFNLPITVSDIRTLTGLNWLNDNVINYYMNLINQRSENQTKYPKSYCFNTFFYPKLINTGPSSLKRWTKKIDLFTYDLICIPVHLSVHWCMAIINLKDKTIKYYDSMGSDNNVCLKALKDYLEFEHMDKKNQPYDTNDYRLENVKDIPQQMNGCDCGMFACTFAEFATRRAKFTFTQKNMPYLRQKMIVEILHGKLLIEQN